MIAIAVFFWFWFVPGTPQPQQPQQPQQPLIPPECPAAIDNYMALLQQLEEEADIKYEQVFGRPVSTGDEVRPGECPLALRFWRWKLQREKSALPARNTMVTACASVGTTAPMPEIMASLAEKVAGCH